MASLRSRLIVSLLAIAAVGLVLLAGITYAGQRDYLLDRLDAQIRGAPPVADRALGVNGPRGGRPARRDRGGGPPPGGALPPGTYLERRDPAGAVVVREAFDYGQALTIDPALPREVPVGEPFTVSGRGEDDSRYRAYALADVGGVTIVAAPTDEIDAALRRLLALEAVVVVAILLVLGLVARWVVRAGLLPLERMGHVAGAIAGGDLSHRVPAADPRTEVGRLGAALNAMLDRLEGAFRQREASEDRLRRFLADASHELRTPLAAIRGYAELFRMGAAREPAEVERAMGRIEDEAARMGVLVEDLLTLARLDEIAEAPHAEVGLEALAADAVEDARATAPDRTIALAAEPGATVLGDAHQLRQVLANLLRNALVHTPAGTPVDVGVEREDGHVRLDVRDHGPGLPTDDPSALFERFWRAEGGRERGRAGSGLGLAIVAAIVDAHGGEVAAADAPGGGAVFSVRLPAA